MWQMRLVHDRKNVVGSFDGKGYEAGVTDDEDMVLRI